MRYTSSRHGAGETVSFVATSGDFAVVSTFECLAADDAQALGDEAGKIELESTTPAGDPSSSGASASGDDEAPPMVWFNQTEAGVQTSPPRSPPSNVVSEGQPPQDAEAADAAMLAANRCCSDARG